MAWIATVAESEAEGDLARIYSEAVGRAGKVFNILKVQSSNPGVLDAGIGLYRTIMFGPSPLSRVRREMLATVVSWANACHY